MGNGSSLSHRRNGCHFCVVLFEKCVATGIKGNDRCRDAGNERLGSYDASILRKFRPTNQGAQRASSPGFGPFLGIRLFR